MSILVIPTSPDDPFYTQVSELDGLDWTLTFRYNQREDRWYLTIGDAEGADLIKGIKLVTGLDLLSYLRKSNTPKGQLFVIPSDSNTGPPGLGELGDGRRCVLVYVEP